RHKRGSPMTDALHPLEPLTPDEILAAVAIIKKEKRLASSFRFVTVTLHEPPKQSGQLYAPADSLPRQAFLILLDNATGKGYEAVVDLPAEKVARFDGLPDRVQPPIMLDEFIECEEAVKRSPEFLAALKKRGLDDVSLVMVDPWSAGVYGGE